MTKNDYYYYVKEINSRIYLAKRDLNFAVKEARKYGVTWAEIGDALCISKQAAYQRFSK